MEEVEKEDKKKVVVSGAATGEEDAFPKVENKLRLTVPIKFSHNL